MNIERLDIQVRGWTSRGVKLFINGEELELWHGFSLVVDENDEVRFHLYPVVGVQGSEVPGAEPPKEV